MPVAVLKTGLANAFWQAVTLRDHLWHRRSFDLKLCAIRDAEAIFGIGKGEHAAYPKGAAWADWGGATALVFATGPRRRSIFTRRSRSRPHGCCASGQPIS